MSFQESQSNINKFYATPAGPSPSAHTASGPSPVQWQIPLQFTIDLIITPQFPQTAKTAVRGAGNGQPAEALPGAVAEENVEAPIDYSNREGYRVGFLGDHEKHQVPLPRLSGLLERDAAPVKGLPGAAPNYELKYQHFSIIMNKKRRMPFLTAVNIDGNQLRRVPRGGDKWNTDPRIDRQHQFGNELYSNNELDRGHMVRRLDPVWGPAAAVANEDTFHYTNACPQHEDLNQKTWNDLEDYILDNAGAHDLKVSVFTGPVLRPDDKPYRGARIPGEFWKVAVVVDSQTQKLSATAYLLSQADMISNLEFAFGAFSTYQVPVSHIEALTDLDFGTLKDFDPIGSGNTESIGIRRIKRARDIVFR